MELATEIAIGFISGMLAGMLGIGGAIVLIPGMVLLLGVDQHTAQGVSLGVIMVTALAGSVMHYRLGNIRLSLALAVAPTAVLFAFLGSELAGMLQAPLLTRLFGILMLVAAGRMLFSK